MIEKSYFEYSQEAIDYLKAKDQRLAQVIEQIGPIRRAVIPDIFTAIINNIVSQQISTKAAETVWARFEALVGQVNVSTLNQFSIEDLQSIGISFRKATYIKEFVQLVADGHINLDTFEHMSDEEIIAQLVSIKGIGVWTAEMLLIFSLQRQNILSYGDLAIIRGLRMVYHHRQITPKLFKKYQRRYAPYASVASLYLWAVAGGAIPSMKDYAPKKKEGK